METLRFVKRKKFKTEYDSTNSGWYKFNIVSQTTEIKVLTEYLTDRYGSQISLIEFVTHRYIHYDNGKTYQDTTTRWYVRFLTGKKQREFYTANYYCSLGQLFNSFGNLHGVDKKDSHYKLLMSMLPEKSSQD